MMRARFGQSGLPSAARLQLSRSSAFCCFQKAPRMWGQDWEAALAAQRSSASECSPRCLATPHPAAGASGAEAAEWEAVLSGGRTEPAIVAAIECGSHSTRLLITDGATDLERMTVDTCLGAEGAALWGSATEAPPGRPDSGGGGAQSALAALERFGALLRARGAARARAVGTAALREAAPASAAAFQSAARRALGGTDLEILSGHEEGALAFAGAASSLEAGQPVLLVDLGGRSTEFCYGVAGGGEPQWVASIPLGCLSVQRAAAGSRGWAAAAEAVLNTHGAGIAARLREQEQQRAEGEQRQQQQQQQQQPSAAFPQPTPAAPAPAAPQRAWRLAATGGTVTTAAAAALGLPAYEHARVHMARLGAARLMAMADEFAGAEAQARAVARFSWLTRERAASLAPGCAALAAVVWWLERQRGANGGGGGGGGGAASSEGAEVIVSDRDLLDGLALRLLEGP
ncbi:MAG: Ppx/GppA phosphatase family-domain-containing protein [Monoraphidium minutum]|nr:MAG: Ppx/GppA phosphatase family-domain-containing protein [Monoraphidium minutum]